LNAKETADDLLRTTKHIDDASERQTLLWRWKVIFLTRQEIRRLLTVARSKNPLHHAALLVSFLHGLRVSESLAICGKDIADDKLAVKRSKRSRPTLHDLRLGGDPLFDESILIELAAKNPGRLFDWSRQWFDVVIKAYGTEAGIHLSKLSHHKLKHSIAMVMWTETHDLNCIQDHFGHRSASSTLVYMRAEASAKAITVMQEVQL
jgi:Phage integrase family